ncbi:MAG: hypothetical protein IKE94_08960 [Aeriscardovia sp.]|nr:hypothetical protein [Aeriscardovia sp.]
MKYRNKKTGIIFHSNAICKGDDIEIMEEVPASSSEEKPKKRKKAKE